MKEMGKALGNYNATTPCIAVVPRGAVRDNYLFNQDGCCNTWREKIALKYNPGGNKT